MPKIKRKSQGQLYRYYSEPYPMGVKLGLLTSKNKVGKKFGTGEQWEKHMEGDKINEN